MSRPMGELEVRALLVVQLEDEELRAKLVKLAKEKSPSAVFSLAQVAARLAGKNPMESLALAKATRWLAVVRRDYGQAEFERIVKSQ